MSPLVQVYDGWEDAFTRLQELRREVIAELRQLVQDLNQTARYLEARAAITSRLVFVDDLVDYVKGERAWSLAVRGYNDLKDIASLELMKVRGSTMMRITMLLSNIDRLRAAIIGEPIWTAVQSHAS